MAVVKIERGRICPEDLSEEHALLRVWVDGKVFFDGAYPDDKEYEDMSDDEVLADALWWVPDGFKKICEALGAEVTVVDNTYQSVDEYEKAAE